MVKYFLDGEMNYINNYFTGPEYAMQLLKSNDYYMYRENSLGYITRAIKIASDGQFVGIKPYCEDGRPSYVFTESSQFMADLPLFEPLIVDEEAYERLEEQGKVDGYLIIDLRMDEAYYTKGISPTAMSNIELEQYGAKIPLADQFGGFGYPIKNVTLYSMVNGLSIASKDLTPDQYTIDGLGNLYFYSPVGDFLPSYMDVYLYMLKNQIEYSSLEIHYTCVIKVAKVILDEGSDDSSRDALMQSVFYSIMDYMDVYTFGETTANMIAEVGYTQAMTVTSTAITAPLLVLGAWATKAQEAANREATNIAFNANLISAAEIEAGKVVKATFKATFKNMFSKQSLASIIQTVAIKTVSGVISETVEEIVIDGLIETFFQSLVTKLGGTADLGHWVSTLMTTARETKFFSSFFTTGGQTTQIGSISQELAVIGNTISDMNQNQESISGTQIHGQNQAQALQLEAMNQEASLSLKKLLKAGLLVGLSLIMPSMAGLNLYAITKALGGTINQAFTSANNFKPQIQALAERNRMVSGEALATFQYTDIGSLFYEIPITDGIIETASPTIEATNAINNPMGASLSYNRFRTGVYYDKNDNLDGGYITKLPEDQEKEAIQKQKYNLNEMVTSQSVSNEISTKKLTFRLTGASPDVAFREISIDLSKSRTEILTDIKTTCGYNPDTQLKYMVNGKMRDVVQIVKMADLGDIISIIPVQESAASFTVEQYKLLSEIYQMLNLETKNQIITTDEINQLLKDIGVSKNLIRDLFNFPMDLDTVLHLQYRFEMSTLDHQLKSAISQKIEDYIFQDGIVLSNTEHKKALFGIYSKIAFIISDIKGHFFGTKDMSKDYLKESSKNHISDILNGEMAFTSEDWQKLRWLVLQHTYTNKEVVSNMLNTLNDPIFEDQYAINTKRELKTVFPFSEQFPEGYGGGRLKFIVSDDYRASLLENLEISEDNIWNSLIDKIRQDNHWGKWNEKGSNVAIIKFNFRFTSGLIQKGYIFSISGEQILADSSIIIDGKFTLNQESYFNKEYPAKQVEYDRYFDAERKGIITLESMFPMERIAEGDITIVSERPYCLSCRFMFVIFANLHPELAVNLVDAVRFK